MSTNISDYTVLNTYAVLASSGITTINTTTITNNGNTIYQDMECNNVEYYHLECKKHCAIFANNVLAETYLDANNRNVFDK